jgi:hypothetical protein
VTIARTAAINGAGGTAKFMLLPAQGIKGNGHMMMGQEQSSDR